MLRWSVIFFIATIIAAIFGFGGLIVSFAHIAKLTFFICLAVFVVMILIGTTKNK